jgi:hypothetical protein
VTVEVQQAMERGNEIRGVLYASELIGIKNVLQILDTGREYEKEYVSQMAKSSL